MFKKRIQGILKKIQAMNLKTMNEMMLFEYNDLYQDEMDDLLSNYEIFDVTRLDTESQNGIIYDFIFLRGQTEILNCILKCNKTPNKNNDNLFYEYLVGKSINVIKQYIPNFIYTFLYDSNVSNVSELYANKLNNSYKTTNEDLRKIIQDDHTFFKKTCDSKESAILIEKITNSITSTEFIEICCKENTEIADYYIYSVLYQLYTALNSMKNIYTHYDLHLGNVLLYVVPDNKVVELNYYDSENLSKKPLKIYAKYIPIIIDYGRNFINVSGKTQRDIDNDIEFNSIWSNSKNILTKICKTDCNVLPYNKNIYCNLESNGIPFVSSNLKDMDLNESYLSGFGYITPNKKNHTHDLIYFFLLFGELMRNGYIINHGITKRLTQLYNVLEKKFDKFGFEEDKFVNLSYMQITLQTHKIRNPFTDSKIYCKMSIDKQLINKIITEML